MNIRYQTAMRPTVPSSEIEKVSRELEKFASEFGEVVIPESIPRCDNDEKIYVTVYFIIRLFFLRYINFFMLIFI